MNEFVVVVLDAATNPNLAGSFADSSVIVKLYVLEAGYAQVRRLERPLIISGLATVEVAGAMWRKQRLGELEPAMPRCSCGLSWRTAPNPAMPPRS